MRVRKYPELCRENKQTFHIRVIEAQQQNHAMIFEQAFV
jgi:hypothetical protein